MQPEDFHEFTRTRPFAPFRIYVTDGRKYEVRHPDQVIPLRSRVVIGVGEANGVPERTEHVSLLHIVRLEEIAPASTRKRKRKGKSQ